MNNFCFETERLKIATFNEGMVQAVHLHSLEEDMRNFVPDEVFETVDEALETVLFLMECYKSTTGPFVFPVFLKDDEQIGYVQAVPTDSGWEVGYHIARKHTNKGYATEAVIGFLPAIMPRLGVKRIEGICAQDNCASMRVLEKAGFALESICEAPYHGKMRTVCYFSFEL